MNTVCKKVYILRGLPGSGKSTLANNLAAVSPDSVICSNDNYPGYSQSYEWTPEKFVEAKKYCVDLFKQCLKENRETIIVDNCHLTHNSYRFFVEEAKNFGYTIEIITKKPKEEELELYAKRNLHNVTLPILRSMFKIWED